jgi:hypothetical protein
MNLRILFTINAVLAIFHGVGFIAVPGQMLALYQIAGSPATDLMGQLFGAELLVVAIITWVGRNLTDEKALSGIVIANLVADIVGTILSVKGVLGGVTGMLGWMAVAIYAFLAIAYLSAFMQRKGSPSPAA